MQDATPIIQAMQNAGQTLVEMLRTAVIGLWNRDEMLFFAVVALALQAAWILRLRIRVRRLLQQLTKARSMPPGQGQGGGNGGSGNGPPLYTTAVKKAKSVFRPQDEAPRSTAGAHPGLTSESRTG